MKAGLPKMKRVRSLERRPKNQKRHHHQTLHVGHSPSPETGASKTASISHHEFFLRHQHLPQSSQELHPHQVAAHPQLNLRSSVNHRDQRKPLLCLVSNHKKLLSRLAIMAIDHRHPQSHCSRRPLAALKKASAHPVRFDLHQHRRSDLEETPLLRQARH
jgi:hypothetical protein